MCQLYFISLSNTIPLSIHKQLLKYNHYFLNHPQLNLFVLERDVNQLRKKNARPKKMGGHF